MPVTDKDSEAIARSKPTGWPAGPAQPGQSMDAIIAIMEHVYDLAAAQAAGDADKDACPD